jgi:hypothetical protein
MTTAYRSDLIATVYHSEIAGLVADLSVKIDPTVLSCPKNCPVQYRVLIPREATAAETVRYQDEVAKALLQQYCPHHPPKIELDFGLKRDHRSLLSLASDHNPAIRSIQTVAVCMGGS